MIYNIFELWRHKPWWDGPQSLHVLWVAVVRSLNLVCIRQFSHSHILCIVCYLKPCYMEVLLHSQQSPHQCYNNIQLQLAFSGRHWSQFTWFTNPTMHIFHIPQNAPFITKMYTFLFWMVHCGIWTRCIVGFVILVHSDMPGSLAGVVRPFILLIPLCKHPNSKDPRIDVDSTSMSNWCRSESLCHLGIGQSPIQLFH